MCLLANRGVDQGQIIGFGSRRLCVQITSSRFELERIRGPKCSFLAPRASNMKYTGTYLQA